MRRPQSLSELTPITSNTKLTHLGSEASIYHIEQIDLLSDDQQGTSILGNLQLQGLLQTHQIYPPRKYKFSISNKYIITIHLYNILSMDILDIT